MATPTTLLAFATQERDAYQAAQTRAEADLAAAQAELTQAAQSLAADVKAAAELERSIGEKRAQLASTTVPADATALVAEITALVIQRRTLQAQILDREDTVAAKRAEVTTAKEAAQRATALRAAAEAQIVREQRAQEQRQPWKTAVTQPPLDTLQAEAAAALEGAEFTAAEAEIEELPEKIRETAVSRYGVYRERLDRAQTSVATAEDLLASEHGANGGVEGVAAQRRIAFVRAERALRDYASSAADRLAFALALLQDVGATDLLSVPEKGEIDEAALVAAGESAADLGIARDDAQKTMDQKRAALDDVTLEQRAEDPDADVTTVPDVQEAQDEFAAAETDRDDAQIAFAAEKDALAEWLSIVPDRAWRKVRAFHDASAILNELSTTVAATLVSGFATAEQALAAALAEAAQRRRAVAVLDQAIALRTAVLMAALSARDSRLLSAARGDS